MSERLNFNLDVPLGHCGLCGRAPEEDVKRLTMEVSDGRTVCTVVACRWCLSEHAPELLAEIEAAEAEAEA